MDWLAGEAARQDHAIVAGTPSREVQKHFRSPRKDHEEALASIAESYSAQQESFAGSLRREMATILSASAIVG
jgi:hypothetical protein